MGSIIRAVCECGYDSGDIYQGGGFLNFMKEDIEPAYCRKCKKLVIANHMLKHPKCPDCKGKIVFYDNQELWSEDSKLGYCWGNVVIPFDKCFCPQCGKKTMKFQDVGLWD